MPPGPAPTPPSQSLTEPPQCHPYPAASSTQHGSGVRRSDPQQSRDPDSQRGQRGPGVVEAREYSLALESFCGTLLDENKHVTPALYSRIQNLAEQLDGVDSSLIDSVKAAIRAE
jgi:hypothetical protein